jgi:hypothetical protein
MLARAGIDVRAEVVTMLPALYAALAASGDEELSEAGERAVAWVVGLPEDSPLIPVTDVLLAAPQLGLDPDAAVEHLFGIPAFTQPVRPQDRGWHNWPGTELPARRDAHGDFDQVAVHPHVVRGGNAEHHVDGFAGSLGRRPAIRLGPEGHLGCAVFRMQQ